MSNNANNSLTNKILWKFIYWNLLYGIAKNNHKFDMLIKLSPDTDNPFIEWEISF
jgi:hypothetical protein